MFKNVISIIFLVIAGFFFYSSCLLMFMNFNKDLANANVIMSFVILVFGLIPLAIGLAVVRFENWKRKTGITMVSGAGFTLFVVISFVSMIMDPKLKDYMPEMNRMGEIFNNYIIGIIYLLIFSGVGIFLIKTPQKNSKIEKS